MTAGAGFGTPSVKPFPAGTVCGARRFPSPRRPRKRRQAAFLRGGPRNGSLRRGGLARPGGHCHGVLFTGPSRRRDDSMIDGIGIFFFREGAFYLSFFFFLFPSRRRTIARARAHRTMWRAMGRRMAGFVSELQVLWRSARETGLLAPSLDYRASFASKPNSRTSSIHAIGLISIRARSSQQAKNHRDAGTGTPSGAT